MHTGVITIGGNNGFLVSGKRGNLSVYKVIERDSEIGGDLNERLELNVIATFFIKAVDRGIRDSALSGEDILIYFSRFH